MCCESGVSSSVLLAFRRAGACTHVDEVLVLALEVQLSIEGRKLEALAHAQLTLLPHRREKLVVLRFGPDARTITVANAAMRGYVRQATERMNGTVLTGTRAGG